jgi:uncharacterized membrane protein YfhO
MVIKRTINKIKDAFSLVYKNYRASKFGALMGKFFSKGNRRFVLSLYLIALLVFGATLLGNQLVIAITGDFKLQEIPFYFNGYDDWWDSLLEGEFKMWDDSGFLGQNNIGTNTFYYLWNIFFLPTLLFPRALVPQALAILIITKFVLAGYVMKRLLDYFNVSSRNAKLVATAYAFSGWAFYYLWFNHFLEIAVLFPLVLLGIEKCIQEKKVGTLILSLFVSAMTNYFFFIMFCFTGVIYALFRYFQLWKTYTGKERLIVILLGIASFAIAIIMASIILLPAFKVAMQSSRADTSSGYVNNLKEALKTLLEAIKGQGETSFGDAFKNLWELCTKFTGTNAVKNNMYPLVSYFFAPYSCYDSPLFNNTGYDNTNCSLFMYTPLTLLLVPSLIQSAREKKISHFIGFIGVLFMIFSPFFYYCFTGFTSVCYGRWQLFVVAIGCIYAAINLDKIDKMKGWYFDISVLICLAFEIVLITLAVKYQGTMSTNNLITSSSIDDQFICALIQPLILIFMYIIIRNNFKKKNFGGKINFALIAEIVFVGNMVLLGQGTVDYSSLYGGQEDVKSATKLINKINQNDDTYFRIFNTSADRDANNLGMVEGYRGIGSFHSMYNYSLDEFGEWSRITYSTSSSSWRPWSMGVHEKRANLDTFLGVKYYVVNTNDSRMVKNNNIVSIENGKWVLNESKTNIEAFTHNDVFEDSNSYAINSIALKEVKEDNLDVYTVVFANKEGSTKTYNVTIGNKNAINISLDSNGEWYFNTLKIGVHGCPNSISSTSKAYISSFQKIDTGNSDAVYNVIFSNGESGKAIISRGEDKNVPFGYHEIDRDDYNVVYENENFINLGFAFDSLTSSDNVISSDNFSGGTYVGRTIKNEAAYVRTAIVSSEDLETISEAYPDTFELYDTYTENIYNNNKLSGDVNVVNLKNTDVKIYLQNWNHTTGQALGYASPVNYPGTSIQQIYWNSYMDVDLSSYNVASEASSRGGAFVTVNGRMGENLMISLYGKDSSNNEIELARDIHMRHNYDKSGDWKYERGFYVDSKVTRVVVRAYDTFAKGKQFARPDITYQYYDTYKANIDKLKQNELKNVELKTNGFKFDTDYSETKMEVLTIPYDEGWSLTRISEDGVKTPITLYKAQGGFNSFVAEKGNFSYELRYETPGLKTGILGFGLGLMMFSALYVTFDIELTRKQAIKKQLGL